MSFYVLSLMLLVVSLMSLMISISLFSSMEVNMEWEMILIELGSVPFLCLLDFMSMMFFSTVMLIAGKVMLYSTSYMSNDKVISRFGLTVFSFVLSMILLIFHQIC